MTQVAKKKSPEAKPKRARGAGSKEVYETLRNEIMSLELEPGTPLDESKLSQRFGLSRSPIREALIRLGNDNLVVMLPNRSTLVAPFDVESLPKYLDALDLMQRTTTRLAAMARTDADMEAIKHAHDNLISAVKSGDVLGLIESNREFHVRIAEACKNQYFASLYIRLLDEGRRMLRMYFAFLNDELPEELLNEHVAMINAIEQRDPDAAEHWAKVHTDQFGERFFEYLSHRMSSGISLRG